MASMLRHVTQKAGVFLNKSPGNTQILSVPRRGLELYTQTGGVQAKPEQVEFGLLKLGAVVSGFVGLGATLSYQGAEFLDEYELFSPDDDDD